MSPDTRMLLVSLVAVAVFWLVVFLSNPERLERRRRKSRWWTRPPS